MFIDTIGLGSNVNEDHDRNAIAELKNDLQKITNIHMCFLFVMKEVRLSGSFIESIGHYKDFQAIDAPSGKKVVFKTILTHCDLDSKASDPANDD